MKWWDPCESPGWLSSCDSVGQLMGFKKGLNRRFPFEKEKQKRRPNGSLPSVCSPLDLLDLNQSSYGATVGFRSLCFQGARTREMDLGSTKDFRRGRADGTVEGERSFNPRACSSALCTCRHARRSLGHRRRRQNS
ncbi:unnamed protein product [Musa acuminata var. zebrina]